MKVIEKREAFENWNLEAICTGKNWNQNGNVPCNSTLELETNDLLKRKWFKYPDNNGVDYGFICPICGCFTPIHEKYLSANLKNMVKDFELTNR